MPKKIAKIPEVADDLIDETIEEPEPVQSLPVKLNKKTGKPLLSDEEKRQIRIENLQRAKKAKEERDAITTSLKQSKKELTHLELERQKEELELVKKKIDEISSKPMPKKLTRKQAVQEQYEDEDEEEEVIVKPKRAPRARQAAQHQEPSYSNLVKQTAADQIRQRLENERIKMAMLSIMPSYKF
jgi:hypothetical protein